MIYMDEKISLNESQSNRLGGCGLDSCNSWQGPVSKWYEHGNEYSASIFDKRQIFLTARMTLKKDSAPSNYPCSFWYTAVWYRHFCFESSVSELSKVLNDINYSESMPSQLLKTKTKLHGLSPRANYTDRATAACRRSDCQRLRIESATWSAWRIPTAVFSVF
jgi:hypothetical protein